MEFYTKKFVIRNEIIPMKNPNPSSVTLCALDIGYSAVKGYSAASRFCFPAFASEKQHQILGDLDDMDILYKDEHGTEYIVGSKALHASSTNSTNVTANTLCARDRYYDPNYLIYARVGIALAMGEDHDKPIILQTGLPPAYLDTDSQSLREALAGYHDYSIKVGKRDWERFTYTLAEDDIYIMSQPFGSMYCALKDHDAKTIPIHGHENDGRTFVDCNTIVLDGGFGTLDVFGVQNRVVKGVNTFDAYGMRVIYEKTIADIKAKYNRNIPLHMLQNYLHDGMITVVDKRKHTSTKVDITGILKENLYDICEKAMTKIELTFDNLIDYDYLIVTGGTGAAWYSAIKDRYAGMETIQIISANHLENIPPVYNNVRGYYLSRVFLLLKADAANR